MILKQLDLDWGSIAVRDKLLTGVMKRGWLKTLWVLIKMLHSGNIIGRRNPNGMGNAGDDLLLEPSF